MINNKEKDVSTLKKIEDTVVMFKFGSLAN